MADDLETQVWDGLNTVEPTKHQIFWGLNIHFSAGGLMFQAVECSSEARELLQQVPGGHSVKTGRSIADGTIYEVRALFHEFSITTSIRIGIVIVTLLLNYTF